MLGSHAGCSLQMLREVLSWPSELMIPVRAESIGRGQRTFNCLSKAASAKAKGVKQAVPMFLVQGAGCLDPTCRGETATAYFLTLLDTLILQLSMQTE